MKPHLLSLTLILSLLIAKPPLCVASPMSQPVVGGLGVLSGAPLPSFSYDDYDWERYEQILQEAQQKERQDLERSRRAQQDLVEAQDKDAQINRSIEQVAQQLRNLQEREVQIQATIANARNQITSESANVQNLQAHVTNLQTQIESTQRQISDLSNQLGSATDEGTRGALKSQLDQKTSELSTLQNQLSKTQSRIEQSGQKIAELQSYLNTLPRDLEKTRNESQQLQGSLSILNQQKQEAQRAIEIRRSHKMLADRELEFSRRDVEAKEHRLSVIHRNIDIAGRILTDQGRDQGGRDGYREGVELGINRGLNEGLTRGERDGTQQGITDGKSRDHSIGIGKGQRQASVDATNQSTKDATTKGSSEGQRQGKTDGLAAAYELGKSEGLSHGAATGSDTIAYAEGIAQGKVDGLVKAVEDAKPQNARGYTDKENQFLNSPLAKVLVGDQELGKKLLGLQGIHSPEGDDRYYSPQPGMLPHPRLAAFYFQAYDETYRTNLSSAYNLNYRQQYDTSYNQAFSNAKDREFKKSYPDSERAGFQKGYSDTYQTAYDSNYSIVYASTYRQNYDQAYAQYRLDAPSRARGFSDGNRIASRQKGFNESFKKTYDDNIGPAMKKAYQDGSDRASTLYTNNPIIKIESLEIVESDQDGVFRPSETVQVIIKLKNFGLKAKTDLVSEIKSEQGPLTVLKAQLQSPSIPPQSHALIVMPAQAAISSNAADGNRVSLNLRALTGQTVHLQAQQLLTAQYPAQVSLVGFDGVLVPGIETNLKVRVTNRSKSAQTLRLDLGIDSGKVLVNQNYLTVDALAAGSSKDLELKLTGKMEARFEETHLGIVTTQSNSLWAMDVQQVMTIIKRHVATNNSRGLIISSNLARGAGKQLYSTDKFDTWDLRIDGALRDSSVLDSYKDKVIHIMADQEATIDIESSRLIQQNFAANRSMVIWGSRLDQSQVAAALLPQLGVQVTQVSTTAANLVGSDRFAGLHFDSQSEASLLASSSINTAVALKSGSSAVGTLTTSQGTKEQVGLALVVGLNLSQIEAPLIKDILNQLDLARTPFAKKLELAMTSPERMMFQVALDMTTEMIAAEALGTGSFYGGNAENNKIFRAGAKFIKEAGKNSTQAKEISKFYPYFVNILTTHLKKEQWKCSLVLDKRHGGFFNARSFKDIYCNSNSSDPVCQNQLGGG